MLHQIVYISSSRSLDITDFVEDSMPQIKARNASVDVSGLLVFSEGTFLQVLEGDKHTVHHLYDKISRDTRHQKVNILLERTAKRRSFPNWAMGWGRIADDHPLADELRKVSSADGVRNHCGDVNDRIMSLVEHYFNVNRD